MLLDNFNSMQMVQLFTNLFSFGELYIQFHMHDHNPDFVITNTHNLYILVSNILLTG